MSVRVRLCVLWNYICEFWDRHLKKPIIPFWCRLSLRHRRTAQKKMSIKKKRKENPLSLRLWSLLPAGRWHKDSSFIHRLDDWKTMFDALNVPHYVFLSLLSAGLERNSLPEKENLVIILSASCRLKVLNRQRKTYLELHNKKTRSVLLNSWTRF